MLQQRAQARRSTDIKLIFVPLIFFLLRVWSAIIDIPIFYSHRPAKHPYGGAIRALVVIAVGIYIITICMLGQSKLHIHTHAIMDVLCSMSLLPSK